MKELHKGIGETKCRGTTEMRNLPSGYNSTRNRFQCFSGTETMEATRGVPDPDTCTTTDEDLCHRSDLGWQAGRLRCSITAPPPPMRPPADFVSTQQ